MIKAIIFDADHTLYSIDVKDAYHKMFSYLAEETGLDYVLIKTVWHRHVSTILNSSDSRNVLKRKREYVLDITLNQLDVEKEKISGLIEKALDIFWSAAVDSLGEKPNMLETIKTLSDKKDISLAVASDEYAKSLEMKLNRIFGDWEKYFEFLISSEVAGELKPSDKYWDAALEKLGVEPGEVAVVGDSWIRDLEIPSKLGMVTVLLSDEMEGSPAFFINDISELENVLDV